MVGLSGFWAERAGVKSWQWVEMHHGCRLFIECSHLTEMYTEIGGACWRMPNINGCKEQSAITSLHTKVKITFFNIKDQDLKLASLRYENPGLKMSPTLAYYIFCQHMLSLSSVMSILSKM